MIRCQRLQMTFLALTIVALASSACGGAETRLGEGSARGGEEAVSDRAAEAGGTEAGEMELGAIDPGLAARGEELFRVKGCAACHKVGGGRLVGPDLAGVTERRSPEFIIAMIVNPDSMLANDETARQLLAEYFTPMTNQGVDRQDARAMLEYLRRYDAENR